MLLKKERRKRYGKCSSDRDITFVIFVTEWEGVLFGVMLPIITILALWECDAGVMSKQGQL